MKITILGAGSMGSLIGSYLSRKHEITMIDYFGKIVDHIKENGIEIIEQDNSARHYKPKAFLSGTCDEVCDLLIIFVKDIGTDDALRQNQKLIGKDTVVLSLQNGMGNDEIIKKYVKEENILLGTTKHNAHTLEYGVIKHSGSGVTHIGSLVQNMQLASEVAEVLNECGFETEASNLVNHLLWEKIFVNITINALTCILQTTMDFMSYDSPLDTATSNVLKEAIAVAKADGEQFDYETVKRQLYDLTTKYIGGKASMEQDVELKRKTEIDFINGSIVRLGKKYNIPTPVNETIVSLVHSKEALYK